MAQPNVAPITATCVANGSDYPVDLPATHPVVVMTAYLGWDAGPTGAGDVAQARLASWKMIVVFDQRLTISQSPIDIPAARCITPLNLALAGAAWARILNQLMASSFDGIVSTCRSELIDGIAALTLQNPADLIITAVDWLLGEDTTFVSAVAPIPAVAAAPAVRAQGRRNQAGYVPARPAVPGRAAVPGVLGRPALDPALRFLSLVCIIELEEPGESAWVLLSYLMGLLGACLSQPERNRASSQVQLSARALATGCHRHFGTATTDDYSLAGNLRDYLRLAAHALPKVFLSTGLDSSALRAEGRDAMLYVRDDEGRRAVEQSRVHSLGAMAPTLQTYILGHTPHAGHAYNLVIMGVRALLPGAEVKTTPLHELVPGLEVVLFRNQALLSSAAHQPGVTAATVFADFIRAVQTIRSGAPSSSSSLVSSAGTSGHAPPPSDSYEEALAGPAYLRFQAAMAGADLSSAAGRRAVFEAATVGDCTLPIRLLLKGEKEIAKRDAKGLGALMHLRPFLSEWFTHAASMTDTGTIPLSLAQWSITGEGDRHTQFLDQFLAISLADMDWLGSHCKPGLLHYLSTRDRTRYAAPHAADHYCVPRTVEALADFGQSLFSGIGYPANPQATPGSTAGYSWKTWWLFYHSILRKAEEISTPEAQLDWLADADQHGRAAISLMSKTVHADIFAVEGIRPRVLNATLPYDCAPAAYLRKKLAEYEEDQERERRSHPFGRGPQRPPVRHHAHELPLLSSRAGVNKRRLRGGAEGSEDAVDVDDALVAGADGGRLSSKAPKRPAKRPPSEKPPQVEPRPREGRRSQVKVPVWVAPGRRLMASGWVWRVPELAKHLGISPIDAKCWEVILSQREGANKQACCSKGGRGAAHASLKAPAHTIPNFDLNDYLDEFAERPTSAEYELALSKQPEGSVVTRGAGGARGGRGRGSGRSSFQQPTRK